MAFDIKIIGTNHVNQFEVNYQLLDNGGGATGGASCTAGVDYVRQSGPIVFPNSGTNVIRVTATICNDALDENDESFDLVVSGDTGGFNVIDPVGRATIQDDDVPPSLALASSHRQLEGSTGGTTTTSIIWLLTSNGHVQASAKHRRGHHHRRQQRSAHRLARGQAAGQSAQGRESRVRRERDRDGRTGHALCVGTERHGLSAEHCEPGRVRTRGDVGAGDVHDLR